MAAIYKILLIPVFTFFLAGQASAEKYFGLERGFELLEVAPAAASLIPAPDPLVEAAGKVAETELLGVIWLLPGMQRYFELAYDSSPASNRITEYEVVSTRRTGPRNQDPVVYDFPEGSVLLGLSVAASAEEPMTALALHSFWVDPDGSLQYLMQHRAGGSFSPGVYILDLIGDGVLEVVIPWATGVASGGAVDVLAIVPTGGLAYFGSGEPDAGSMYSIWGEFNLLDFDSDGDWEFELSYPVFHPNTGFCGTELVMFNWDEWAWLPGGDRIAEYYRPQFSFYSALLDVVRVMALDPGQYRTSQPGDPAEFSCTIAGEPVELTIFIDPGSGGVDKQLLEQLEAEVAYLAGIIGN